MDAEPKEPETLVSNPFFDNEKECPVCLENISNSRMLACAASHSVCFDCIQKMIEPHGMPCSPSCLGLSVTCPLCRTGMCIAKFQLFSLAMGSHEACLKKFQSESDFETWCDQENGNEVE